MAGNIYYIPKHKGILVTSDFSDIQRRMDIGIDPVIAYIPISIRDMSKYVFDGIGFDKIDDDSFQLLKEIFSKYKFTAVAFHNSGMDLSDVVFDVEHLIIGDNSTISLSANNFKNLKEITFLSLKTFKGKILDKIESVEKLILWYEHKKSNETISMFPNLKEFQINNGSIIELDLTENPLLASLQLHRCLKLEKVVLNSFIQLKEVVVESCKKLDVSNLGDNVTRW